MGMEVRVMTPGGYEYLTKTVACHDSEIGGPEGLASYYTARGYPPGQWFGRGADALGVSGRVSHDQMVALFAEGKHPDADQRIGADIAAGYSKGEALKRAQLGQAFPVFGGSDEVKTAVQEAFAGHNRQAGRHQHAKIDETSKAAIRSRVHTEYFTTEKGRAPVDRNELRRWLADNDRSTRKPTSGYEFVFSPAKSVSVAWAVGDEHTHRVITQAHREAVRETMSWIEGNATYTRSGSQGEAQNDVVGLTSAIFEHWDSRAGDPHLHTHVPTSAKVMRLVRDENGTETQDRYTAVDGRPILASAVTASEHYNAVLRDKLAAAGARWVARAGHGAESKRDTYELAGVPNELIGRFSARAEQVERERSRLIVEFTKEHRREPDPKEIYELDTRAQYGSRSAKNTPQPLRAHLRGWKAQARRDLGDEQGITLKSIQHRILHGPAIQRAGKTVQQVAAEALGIVSEHRAAFTAWNIQAEAYRQAAEADRTGAGDVATWAGRVTEAALAHRDTVPIVGVTDVAEPSSLRRRDGQSVFTCHNATRYTTSHILDAEERLVALARRADGTRLDPGAVAHAIETAETEPVSDEAARGLGLARHRAGRRPGEGSPQPDADTTGPTGQAQQAGTTSAGQASDGPRAGVGVSRRVRLNQGQRDMITALGTSGARVQLALAPAGTGKTTAMAVLAKAWRTNAHLNPRAGVRFNEHGQYLQQAPEGDVTGTAENAESGAVATLAGTVGRPGCPDPVVFAVGPSARAASELGGAVAVPGATIAKIDQAITRATAMAENPAVGPGAARDYAHQRGIDYQPGDLVLIDEAAMSGTMALARVVNYAVARGADVRLVGDEQQLPAVEAGGAIRLLAAETTPVKLREVVRFKDPAQGAASLKIREGNPAGLDYYQNQGWVHEGSLETLRDEAHTRWQADLAAGIESVLIVPRLSDTHELNHAAQQVRVHNGEVSLENAVGLANTTTRIGTGDWIVSRGNRHDLKTRGGSDFVKNGDAWIVEAVHENGSLTVRHRTHRGAVRLPGGYVQNHVELGYAVNEHRTQGMTVPGNAHILTTPGMARQELYPAVTRAAGANHLYVQTHHHVADREQETPAPVSGRSVLEGILARGRADVSATEELRATLAASESLGPLVTRYRYATDRHARARYTAAIAFTESQAGAEKVRSSPAWPALVAALRLAEDHGWQGEGLLTHALLQSDLDQARDPAAYLIGSVARQLRTPAEPTAEPSGPQQARDEREARYAALVTAALPEVADQVAQADGWGRLAAALTAKEDTGNDPAVLLRDALAAGPVHTHDDPAGVLAWRITHQPAPPGQTHQTHTDETGEAAAMHPEAGAAGGPVAWPTTDPDQPDTSTRTSGAPTGEATSHTGDATSDAGRPGATHPDATRTALEQRIVDAHAEAVRYYQAALLHAPDAAPARDYLTARGLAHLLDEHCPQQAGYAPEGDDTLHTHLRSMGYTLPELDAAGLATPSAEGGWTDRFHGRLTLPITDPHGKVVAFTGRAVPTGGGPDTEATDTWRSTPVSPIFDPRAALYGLHEHTDTLTAGASPVLAGDPLEAAGLAARLDVARFAPLATPGGEPTTTQLTALAEKATTGAPLIATGPDTPEADAAAARLHDTLARANYPGEGMRAALPAGPDTGDPPGDPEAIETALAPEARTPLLDVALADRLAAYSPLLGSEDGRLAAERAAAGLVAGMDSDELARAGGHTSARTGTDPQVLARVLYEAAHPLQGGVDEPAVGVDAEDSGPADETAASSEIGRTEPAGQRAGRTAAAISTLGDPTMWRDPPPRVVAPSAEQVAAWQNQVAHTAPDADLACPEYRIGWRHAAGAQSHGIDPENALAAAADAVAHQPPQDPEQPGALFLRRLEEHLTHTHQQQPDTTTTAADPVPWLEATHRQAITQHGEDYQYLSELHAAITDRARLAGETARIDQPAWMAHTQPRPEVDGPEAAAWDQAIAAVAAYRDAHQIPSNDPDAPLGARPPAGDRDRPGYDTTHTLWQQISGPDDPDPHEQAITDLARHTQTHRDTHTTAQPHGPDTPEHATTAETTSGARQPTTEEQAATQRPRSVDDVLDQVDAMMRSYGRTPPSDEEPTEADSSETPRHLTGEHSEHGRRGANHQPRSDNATTGDDDPARRRIEDEQALGNDDDYGQGHGLSY